MDMSGMSGMDGIMMTDGQCSINMLGNWQTIGACFLTYSWHISTEAQFAGSCIGVFLIVVLIEMVRRMGREFDRYIAAQALSSTPTRKTTASRIAQTDSALALSVQKILDQENNETSLGKAEQITAKPTLRNNDDLQIFFGNQSRPIKGTSLKPAQFHPTIFQQSFRSLIYGIQFAGAYIIMLIAMSFNGYVLISIVLGGIVGHFVSTRDTFPFQANEVTNEYDGAQAMGLATSPDRPVGILPEQYNPASRACCN